MLSIDMAKLWSSDIEQACIAIDEATQNINNYLIIRKNNNYSRTIFCELYKDIPFCFGLW